MRTDVTALTTSRGKDGIVTRDLVAVSGRNRTTNAITTAYFWNDFYNENINVVDGITGVSTSYPFVGSGPLISVGDIQFVAEQTITVRNLEASLSQINQAVIDQVLGYDLHEQLFQYWQADFDTNTHTLVTPAISMFVGFIDTVEVVTPKAGGNGEIRVSVRSYQSEMTRKNTLFRTHASEVQRDATDTFYSDTADIKDWVITWGQKKASTGETGGYHTSSRPPSNGVFT